MSSSLQNLSQHTFKESNVDFSKKKVSIFLAEWNSEITEALYKGAYDLLLNLGFRSDRIFKVYVPGSFELTFGAQVEAQKSHIDGIITLGCVIQGETPHFDFICNAVANGVTNVSLKYNKPVIFGVLTTLDLQQAIERSGGKHGNKGDEAAATLAKMFQIL